jgi:hypothetical protein
MSSSSKYSGLAGTILLGTLLGLNYSQYARRKTPLADKSASYNPDDETQPGALFDKDGNPVPLGQTNLPGTEFVKYLRHSLPDISPLVLCSALSALWAIRAFSAMNKVLSRRYSDIVYQIRRPDVIANRITAWKFLGIGGILIPAVGAGYAYHITRDWESLVSERKSAATTLSGLADQSQRFGSLSALRIQRGQLANSVAELSRTLRDGFRP